MQVRIDAVAAEETHAVRRLVLREGRADSVVTFDEDVLPEAIHLAAVDDGGSVVGVATFFPSVLAGRPDAAAWQLRGMAVLPSLQGSGVGGMLLAEGVARVRAAGADVVWANGRDGALGFYERHGWKAVGDGYTYGPAALPHHLVVLELGSG
jgi:predicted N-acetyltransferase YhbS